jgi:hypothetical protein
MDGGMDGGRMMDGVNIIMISAFVLLCRSFDKNANRSQITDHRLKNICLINNARIRNHLQLASQTGFCMLRWNTVAASI